MQLIINSIYTRSVTLRVFVVNRYRKFASVCIFLCLCDPNPIDPLPVTTLTFSKVLRLVLGKSVVVLGYLTVKSRMHEGSLAYALNPFSKTAFVQTLLEAITHSP